MRVAIGNYGVEWGGNRAFSDYHHNDRCHRSTVSTAFGTVRSVDTRAGELLGHRNGSGETCSGTTTLPITTVSAKPVDV